MTHFAPWRLLLLAILPGLAASNAQAGCSRDDIDYYLSRGFSHDQVVRLCGTAPHDNQQPVTAGTHEPEPLTKNSQPPASTSQETLVEQTYLQAVLDAEAVQLTPETLTIIHDRCFPYGEENAIGFREEACGRMVTTIQRKGLKITRVVDPVFLLRDGVLRIQSRISRQMTFRKKIRANDRKAFLHDYPEQSNELDLLLKKGNKPTEVAKRLKKLIR